MNEQILYAAWEHRWYKAGPLRTTCGESLEILRAGVRNEHSGPDFSDARIRIGNTLWAGNVEMHVKSSDWEQHGHRTDASYNNVVLHVVFEHDKDIFTKAGTKIPALELKEMLDPDLLRECLEFTHRSGWLQCSGRLKEVSPVKWTLWLERLAVLRLEEKVEVIRQRLQQTNNDWEETLYRTLASAYGFRVNSPPMEMLAGAIPWKILRRYAGNSLVYESILYGAAGMLNGFFADEYPRKLQNEFIFFRMKHELNILPEATWKLMRLRPRNFPTIRISQFARMLSSHPHLLEEIQTLDDPECVTGIFTEAASDYWKEHYLFDRVAGRISPAMGWESASLLLINAVVPFLFLYGKEKGDQRFTERAMRFLEHTGAENNSAMRAWKEHGVKPHNALQSQALLHLKGRYCSEARCLSCSVGIGLLSSRKPLSA
ncbi:MAG: DUF2851 family protein [Bacteroidia bacterium]|nr:DUF2851 family protein [Bacteroidia bacterium]